MSDHHETSEFDRDQPDIAPIGDQQAPDPDNIVVVLSRTTEPSNIGATCRAMKTMGLSQLRLVDPLNPKGRTAQALAHGALDVLENAQVFDTMDEAVADCIVVTGTTARRRQLRKAALLPPQQLARRLVEHAREGKVALLFGTERTGLTNDEVDLCRYTSMVPTDDKQPSLNLSQAVMLYSWEIRKAWLRVQGKEDWVGIGTSSGAPPERPEMSVAHPHRSTKLPTQHELETMYAHLATSMEAVGYSDFELRKFMTYLRQLNSRAGMVNWELQIYHILAKRILLATGQPRFEGLDEPE